MAGLAASHEKAPNTAGTSEPCRGSPTSGEWPMFRAYLFEDKKAPVIDACAGVLSGCAVLVPTLPEADFAIAPLLTRKLSASDLSAPRLGVLIFHPSLLPIHRGPDAIKWAFRLGERYSGATWFWADKDLDTGDICEQEPLRIQPGESPREFYERAVIPASVRMLRFILEDLKAGVIRRRPQIPEHATCEPPLKSIRSTPSPSLLEDLKEAR